MSEKVPSDIFKKKYEELPRPKSWMPGPPAPWSQVEPSSRSLSKDELKDYFSSQDEKLNNLGGLVGADLPESAIEDLGDNDLKSRPAAVLVPFVTAKEDTSESIESLIVMTRTMTVSTHKGQVSFPGGMKETQDVDMVQTALRETHEEIGIEPQHFEILGQRPAVNTQKRSSLITPVVATINPSLLNQLNPNPDEVEIIHEIKIAELVKPGSYFSEIWDFGESSPTIHMYFVYDSNGLPVFIWGATAHILTDILHCLKP